jgi:hypothetical protein
MAVVINGDTGITSVNGTATAPSITGADTNTGIVYGTDTLSLATAGTTAVTVDSVGDVGIGTATPADPLHIYKNQNTYTQLFVENPNTGASARARVEVNSDAGGVITVANSSTNTGVAITGGASGGGLYSSAGLTNGLSVGTSAGPLKFFAGSTSVERMRIDSSGIVTGTAGNLMLISGSAVSPASGTSLDFPSIPSWVKRITISLQGVSFAASGVAVVRLGVSNVLVTTGYVAARVGFTTTPAMVFTSVTDGVASFGTTVAAAAATGQIVITNLTGNQWVASGQVTRTTDNVYMPTTGSITLAGALTNLSVVATTSTFDLGAVNIMYE